VAGAVADGDARLVLWGLAVVATYGGAWALHWLPGRGRRIQFGQIEIAGAHLIERFRLFFIIALGETVLTMGMAFADEPFELERLLALSIAFTGTVALWWCYFQRNEGVGIELAETARALAPWGGGHLDADAGRARADRGRRRRRDGDSPIPATTRRSASRSSRSAARPSSCSLRVSSCARRSGASRALGRWDWRRSRSSRSSRHRSR
jgi:hypothetical protein